MLAIAIISLFFIFIVTIKTCFTDEHDNKKFDETTGHLIIYSTISIIAWWNICFPFGIILLCISSLTILFREISNP